ncbi:hypothetical protein L210DRAFT_3562748, partial [Boletus edulis BED1]
SPMPFPRLALGFEAIHPAQMIISLPTLSSRAIYISDMASSSTWWSLRPAGIEQLGLLMASSIEIVKGIGRPLRAC